MLPVVAGSSSFTIIDDVWNIFSFIVQVSLIQYQLGCWVSDTPVLSIPVFILVAVGLCLHHRRRVFVRRCLSPLSFSLKTFPAAPQQQLTAAVQPAPAPANESVVLVTYPPYLNSELPAEVQTKNQSTKSLARWFSNVPDYSIDAMVRSAIFIIAHCSLQENS